MSGCPRCHKQLVIPDFCDECGWRDEKPVETPKQEPDYARIEADRQRSLAAVFAEHTGSRACQSTLCPPNHRALSGRDLCHDCAKLEAAGETVPRIRRPAWATRAADRLNRVAKRLP